MVAPPPLRPLLPLAKRLNRNALVVSAVILGMTVLTAVVVVRPSREAPPERAAASPVEERPPVPSEPSFLDQPVRLPTPPDTAAGRGAPRSEPASAARPSSDDAAFAGPGSASGVEGLAARERAFRVALASPLVLAALASAPPLPPNGRAEPDSVPLATQEQQLLNLGDSVLRAAAQVPTGGGGLSSTAPRDARQHRAFLDAAGDAHGATVRAGVQPAGSPPTLRAGTIIPALLLTAIISDLPGDLVAQVSRDVYDSHTQRLLLIPKGARLIGTYDNQVAAGEDRLLVAWTRLIFPDGRSLTLPGLALKDLQGETGAKDQVDTHWRRAFGRALLLSAISAGVQLSQRPQTSVLAPPSAGQVAAGALGQELSNVALELLRRGMDTPPTITIRQGQPVNVFLNGDLVLDGPYSVDDEGRSARGP